MAALQLHDAMMRGLHINRIELDEAWSFVAKKQWHLKPTDPADFGDQYVFLALAGAGKAIVSFRVGKRNGENCRAFLADLRARVLGAPEISSDAFPAYPDAVERAFGIECTFGTIEKHYAVEAAVEAARRYSPAAVVAVTRTRVIGHPTKLSTSYIERQNLTLRMQQRRFTRLTNAFSKKIREPRRGCCAVCRALQFLPGPRNTTGHSRHAARCDRPYLDDRRVSRCGA
jgi:IS1 family transposase